MTTLRDDIIRMAREAGAKPGIENEADAAFLERFAALVAAAERAECANFLERGVDMAGLAGDPVMQKYTVELLLGCSAAIRARSNT